MNPYGARCVDYTANISTIVSAERRVTRCAFGLTFEVELEIGLEFQHLGHVSEDLTRSSGKKTVCKSKVFVSLLCRIRFFFVIQNGFLLQSLRYAGRNSKSSKKHVMGGKLYARW